jgi:LysM repeat protein
MKKLFLKLSLIALILAPTNIVHADDGETIKIQQHQNKVKFVVVQKGKTFYELSKETGISMSLLRKYNEFHPKKDILEQGEILFIEPKKNKSKSNKQHIVNQHTTLREIAQIEAIKLSAMMKLNPHFSPDEKLSKGEKIFLQ